jgi:hypothetical protein
MKRAIRLYHMNVGNDGLGREVLDQFDLLVAEAAAFLAGQRECAAQAANAS